MKKKGVTLFSWGYWGWGTVTDRLVDAFDAAETARGFAPPFFVDIRVSRSVRAPGFRERAFEKMVGQERYRWMKELGNKRVMTRTGALVQIVEPKAAGALLDLALDASRRNQRVIFFCACPVPGPTRCHRTTVAQMVDQEAAKREIPVEIIEWPGGEPISMELYVADKVIKQLREGRRYVPLPEPVDIAKYAALPWYSPVKLKSERDSIHILSGPLIYSWQRWQLRCISDVLDEFPKEWSTAGKELRDIRKENWFEAIGS
jgi:hypothetical protein